MRTRVNLFAALTSVAVLSFGVTAFAGSSGWLPAVGLAVQLAPAQPGPLPATDSGADRTEPARPARGYAILTHEPAAGSGARMVTPFGPSVEVPEGDPLEIEYTLSACLAGCLQTAQTPQEYDDCVADCLIQYPNGTATAGSKHSAGSKRPSGN